jgi:hypothetical protein
LTQLEAAERIRIPPSIGASMAKKLAVAPELCSGCRMIRYAEIGKEEL